MPNLIESVFLGFLQGVTEFLPISSSGHLLIASEILGLRGQSSLAFDVAVHVATLGAVIVYFRKDIADLAVSFYRLIFNRGTGVEPEQKTLILAIVAGTIPAGIIGFLFQDIIEGVFRTPLMVVGALVVGSIFFVVAEKIGTHNKELTLKRGFIIGCIQVLALVPGFSRSGATIAGGILLGLGRKAAARFSFLLAVPIILGAGLKSALDIVGGSSSITIHWGSLLLGCATAFIVGYIAIYFLMNFLKRNSLMVFVWYRIILAVLVLLFV